MKTLKRFMYGSLSIGTLIALQAILANIDLTISAQDNVMNFLGAFSIFSVICIVIYGIGTLVEALMEKN